MLNQEIVKMNRQHIHRSNAPLTVPMMHLLRQHRKTLEYHRGNRQTSAGFVAPRSAPLGKVSVFHSTATITITPTITTTPTPTVTTTTKNNSVVYKRNSIKRRVRRARNPSPPVHLYIGANFAVRLHHNFRYKDLQCAAEAGGADLEKVGGNDQKKRVAHLKAVPGIGYPTETVITRFHFSIPITRK